MISFYTDAGPARGPILYRDVTRPIDVFEEPARSHPIGLAVCIGRIADVAIWRLIIRDSVLPGKWMVIDRELRPVDLGQARPLHPDP